jgi:hypothetical protein
MFFGTVPNQCIEQFLKVIPFEQWGDVFIGCSGTFKIEAAIRSRHAQVRLHGNDVSLFSCALGWALTGESRAITFHSRLEFVQDLVGDPTPEKTAAGVLLAQELAKFSKDNQYCRAHFDYYVGNAQQHFDAALERVQKLRAATSLDSYFAGDWRTHLESCALKGGGIAAFPPFFMGDYDKQFEFISKNVTWEEPTYSNYDPSQLGSIVDHCDDLGINYMILTDQVFENRRPMLEFSTHRKVPHYCYSNHNRSSVRHIYNRPKPFFYVPVDPAKLTRDSLVEVVPAESPQMTYLKNHYLAKNIVHSRAGVAQYLVYIDKMLAGGLIYTGAAQQITFNGLNYKSIQYLYLMSDVTVTTEGRISKLVAMLALSRELIRPIEVRMLRKLFILHTTARSKNHVSMKYRGPYELHSRVPSTSPTDPPGTFALSYCAPFRDDTVQQIYQEWFDVYSGLGAPKAGNRNHRRRSR